jgi:hypothetical protein
VNSNKLHNRFADIGVGVDVGGGTGRPRDSNLDLRAQWRHAYQRQVSGLVAGLLAFSLEARGTFCKHERVDVKWDERASIMMRAAGERERERERERCHQLTPYCRHLAAYARSGQRVDKMGWLHKRGYVNTALKERWFVLKGNLLFYFKDQAYTTREPIGVLVLENFAVAMGQPTTPDFHTLVVSASVILCARCVCGNSSG